MGDTRNDTFINLLAGAELKFPIKYFENFMIEPYAAFALPLMVSDIFHDFPPFALGGGLQFGTKGGKNGALFVDIKYMLCLTDAVMFNPYGELFPKPSVIHYQRFVIGLGVGYKFGFIDRYVPSHYLNRAPDRAPRLRSRAVHVFDF